MKNKFMILLAALGLAGASVRADVILFNEDFGSLANGTTITTSNTDFTYVRVGTQGGSIEAKDPSSFSGSSLLLTGPSAGSLNGVGVGDLGTTFNLVDFSVDLNLANTTGNIVMGVGSGNRFTGNSGFSTDQGLFWLQINDEQLQRRTSSDWVDVDNPLTATTNYSLRVIANGSTGELNYDSETLAAGTMSIFLNGSKLADGVGVTTSLDADAFRIYSVNGGNVELDNISVTAIPEPSTLVLVGMSALAAYGILRRRK